jgi:indolepyruvate ferredoxin oxidoreductase beta subunit
MPKVTNVMFVGVGGQGSLLASKILGHVLLNKGYDVKISEVHGMSQRGGSVVTYVRFGEKVYSPIVPEGEADLVVAFEQLEGARWIGSLKKSGTMIINTQKIDPMPVITGAAVYPGDILEKLQATQADIVSVDALSIAQECGSAKAVNIVLIGILAKRLGFDLADFLLAIDEMVAPKFREMNQAAIKKGYEFS